MPPVTGILETAIPAADPQRTDTLLESDRLIALDVSGRSVLLIFKAGATSDPVNTPGGTHHFAIATDDVENWRRHLESSQVPIESRVTWPGSAQSLYFRDPDHHLVKLITPGFWRNY